MKPIRCAIYTRKSSEEGLEQDFNSLDAQYAACSAYIASQTSEGWTLIARRYDDGGISGGTLDRPALQRLLADIAARQVDIVVVYKVDRLTRSLLDFAKLVEALDKSGTSFVSVTQSFNTTTSMGRLTLNMLLSFAQFEREVTAERIRDKLAASKARGMWMGGTPPLGYRPNGRSLAIVEEHAELVRDIFKLYLELGTVRQLQSALDRNGIVKPVRVSKAGRQYGGAAFGRGELYAILSNPIYIGRIRHRQAEHQGLHEGLIERSLWDLVQVKLADNRNGVQHIRTVVHPSILAGKLFDGAGVKLIASHANKGARRYRYYVSQHLHHGGGVERREGMRIPAPEIEALVRERLADLFDDPLTLVERISILPAPPDATKEAVSRAQAIADSLRGSDPATIADLIDNIVRQIDVHTDSVTIDLNCAGVAKSLNFDVPPNASTPFEVRFPASLKRSGMAMRMILPSGQSASTHVDEKLISAIATARSWWQSLVDNPKLRVADLAVIHSVTESWVTRTLRLAFLDPGIVEMIRLGNHPAHLTVSSLMPRDAVPPLWSRQRAHHRISGSR